LSRGLGDVYKRQVNTLAKNYDPTIALLEEILFEPRWDVKEFELAKQNTISAIRQQEANPNAVAENKFAELLYGKDDIRAKNILGTIDSVNSITIDDLKAYYAKYVSPSVSRMHLVGAIDKAKVTSSLASLSKKWAAKRVAIPKLPTPTAPAESKVYFYDVPDAKQSVLRFGYPALAATDSDYYPAVVMNYILGGGGFASQLTQQLREGKGYTYGINSSFSGTNTPGPFTIGSGVRTNGSNPHNSSRRFWITIRRIIPTPTWRPQKGSS
ncbi:MAG: pitrilysin family protein, partial [Pyrinomonadaceae bacterium]|nr:pitrilysin family protein [Pyrinomonadaceae bacterium]